MKDSNVLSIPPKVTVEPNSFEDIKLKFTPTRAGAYTIKIEILTTPLLPDDTKVEWHRVPYIVNVAGTGEEPDIEVLLSQTNSINFGEVAYGKTRQMELKVLNKGVADVPLKLMIPLVSVMSRDKRDFESSFF